MALHGDVEIGVADPAYTSVYGILSRRESTRSSVTTVVTQGNVTPAGLFTPSDQRETITGTQPAPEIPNAIPFTALPTAVDVPGSTKFSFVSS